MRIRRVAGQAALVLVAGGIGGCSSATDNSAPQEPALATTFDGLSREANASGDPDAAAAFSGAAMTVRLGIKPSDITVTVDGEARSYLAFAHEFATPRASILPDLRTLIAFRVEDGKATEVLYVAAASDSVGLDHPAASGAPPDPLRIGVSSWKDLKARQLYVATDGSAMVKLTGTGAACPNVPAGSSVGCTTATFGVKVGGDYYGLVNNQRGHLDRTKHVTIATRGTVNGAVLVVR